RSVFMLDGVEIVEGRRRTYRYGKLAAHVLGYVNEIDAPRLERERESGNPQDYKLGDMVGRSGLEHTYENELRGVDGYERAVVDVKGRKQVGSYVKRLLGDMRRVAPQPGHNLITTIDLDLQREAEGAFTGQSGAVVALSVR